MKQRSLRLRLLGGAALSIAVALVLAGLAIGGLFIANVEANVRSGLVASLNRLVALVDPVASPPALTGAMADPRYNLPASGIYWQVENATNDALARSRSLWDFTLDAGVAADDGSEHFMTLVGPGGQSLAALVRTVKFSGAPFRLVVAENRAVLNESIARFGWELAAALGILGAALIVAAWAQVRLGLAPLEAIRAGIEAIRHGTAERLPADYPLEVLPLVGEVNTLLDTQETSIAFARARAADLAHGLKTPLAVLETIAGQLRTTGDAKTAGAVEELAAEMADRVDYQMRLSRLRLRTKAHRLSASLDDAVRRTVAVLQKTRDGEQRQWEVSTSSRLAVDLDAHDLIELVGVLLENAAKWARAKVKVTAVASDGMAVLTIEDDGPGLTDAEIGRLGQRGQRLDETSKGSGLGLAIAHEIVGLNNGRIAFGRGDAGGLAVRVELPLADN